VSETNSCDENMSIAGVLQINHKEKAWMQSGCIQKTPITTTDKLMYYRLDIKTKRPSQSPVHLFSRVFQSDMIDQK